MVVTQQWTSLTTHGQNFSFSGLVTKHDMKRSTVWLWIWGPKKGETPNVTSSCNNRQLLVVVREEVRKVLSLSSHRHCPSVSPLQRRAPLTLETSRVQHGVTGHQTKAMRQKVHVNTQSDCNTSRELTLSCHRDQISSGMSTTQAGWGTDSV